MSSPEAHWQTGAAPCQASPHGVARVCSPPPRAQLEREGRAWEQRQLALQREHQRQLQEQQARFQREAARRQAQWEEQRRREQEAWEAQRRQAQQAFEAQQRLRQQQGLWQQGVQQQLAALQGEEHSCPAPVRLSAPARLELPQVGHVARLGMHAAELLAPTCLPLC